LGHNSEPIRLVLKDGFEQLRLIVAKCIREGQSQGEITVQQDAEVLADVLINAREGALMCAQLNMDDRPVACLLSVMIDALLTP
jgi:hypothetical protein